jgi:biopolymer transport protein ExbB
MLKVIIDGGFMMIPLMACSVLAMAVLIDRGLAFWANKSVDVRSLRAEVLSLVHEGRLHDAMTLCASTPGPVSAVMLAGLQAYQKLQGSPESYESMRTTISTAMDDYSLHAMSAVQKRLGVLATIGQASPLFGMAGTVVGMIMAFEKLASAANLEASEVAGGISVALVTTAAGLLIALGAVIPLNFFTSQAQEIELEIEDASSELTEHLSAQLRGAQA